LCVACCAGEIPEGAAMSSRCPPSRPAGSRQARKPPGAARVADGCQSRARTPADALPSPAINASIPATRQRQVRTLPALHRDFLRRWGFQLSDVVVPAFCLGCGPVWVKEDHAGDAWLIASCRWCNLQDVKLVRPPVECGSCRYFAPDPNNANGIGHCTVRRGTYAPHWPHRCAVWWWRP